LFNAVVVLFLFKRKEILPLFRLALSRKGINLSYQSLEKAGGSLDDVFRQLQFVEIVTAGQDLRNFISDIRVDLTFPFSFCCGVAPAIEGDDVEEVYIEMRNMQGVSVEEPILKLSGKARLFFSSGKAFFAKELVFVKRTFALYASVSNFGNCADEEVGNYVISFGHIIAKHWKALVFLLFQGPIDVPLDDIFGICELLGDGFFADLVSYAVVFAVADAADVAGFRIRGVR